MRRNFEKKASQTTNMIIGNSVDIVVNKCDSEIKADIVVSEFNSIRVWGQIKNCYGNPVSNALIKLIKVIKTCNGCKYEGVAHTISDCNGFYQFDICEDTSSNCYKILVGKSATGTERIVNDNNCNPCCKQCNPCSESSPKPMHETQSNNFCCDYTSCDDCTCCDNDSYDYCYYDYYDCPSIEEYIPYKDYVKN